MTFVDQGLFAPIGNPDMFEGLCGIPGYSCLRRFDLVSSLVMC